MTQLNLKKILTILIFSTTALVGFTANANQKITLERAMQKLDQAAADLYRASENLQEARSLVYSAMQTPSEGWTCVITYGGDHRGHASTEDSARDAAMVECSKKYPMNQCKLFRNDKNYSTCHRAIQ